MGDFAIFYVKQGCFQGYFAELAFAKAYIYFELNRNAKKIGDLVE